MLSGTGSDGTQGLRAIKAEGGMAMAQSLASAEFDGMPRSAIATGLIDFELPLAEMPEQLIAYTAHAFGHLPRVSAVPPHQVGQAMSKVFVLPRSQTGHDFSLYKPSTVHRRIERRMAVHQIDTIDDYVKYLQQSPAEVEALFRDLLIGVTSFFRDPDVFDLLQRLVIPKIFVDKSSDGLVRVWTAGCATGEEACSIAILLVEHMETLKASFTVQLFATDIDAQAIAIARAGLYPTSIAADVSAERLARFFKLEPDGSGYRIHKAIRDLLVFSEQSVVNDPPVSRLDLVSCRNLLIYMGTELQRKLIPLFCYALKPGGCLLLGTSDGVGEHDLLCCVVDRKAKVYQRLEVTEGAGRPALGQAPPAISALEARVQAHALSMPQRGLARPAGGSARSLRETTEQAMLAQVIAAGASVNGAGDIHYLHGRTGMFLEPSPGEAGVNNILKMAREGLRRELAASLSKAARALEVVASPDLRLRDDSLRSATEDLASSTEELRSANEEMQSVNEELQSTNEELETSKEELQTKVVDLSRANNDMNNLLAGTGIGTVFVDHPLRILRFTPAASAIINLIPGDVGRPVAQAMAFYDPQAQPVAQAGLQAAIDRGTAWSFELPLTTAKGRAIWVRAQGVAEVHNGKSVRLFGAIQDITERKQVEEALRLANERLLAAERDRP